MIAEGFIRQLYRHIAEPQTKIIRQNVQTDKLIQDISKAETKLNGKRQISRAYQSGSN